MCPPLSSLLINLFKAASNIQERIGKLEVGYDADIVVYDGNPLDIKSKVELTIINGEIVFKRD